MDIVYYRREDTNVHDNESVDPFVIGPDYIKTHPNIAIPYLIVIILATISGTVGNVLVIGAVVINKVRILLLYFRFFLLFLCSFIFIVRSVDNEERNYSPRNLVHLVVTRRIQMATFSDGAKKSGNHC